MGAHWPVSLLVGLVIGTSGCVTKNPAWLDEPSTAYCASQLNQECIKGLAEKSYRDATASLVSRRAQLELDSALPKPPLDATPHADGSNGTTPSPEENEGVPAGPVASGEPLSEVDLPESASGVEVVPGEAVADNAPSKEPLAVDDKVLALEASIPKLAFGVGAVGAVAEDSPGFEPGALVMLSKQAGDLLHLKDGEVAGDQLAKINALPDQSLKAAALYRLLTLYSAAMTDEQVAGALNALHALDQEFYRQALIVKLPGLLRTGDLERAHALRDVLLDGSVDARDSFSVLGYVVSCYTMAGLKQDAGAIVRAAIDAGADLSPDDLKLISMAVSVGNGSYPAMQEFYDYRSDELRMSAYVTLAVIARQLGLDQVAHRAVGDAVKFVQKSSVKLDRASSIAQILAVAPGALD